MTEVTDMTAAATLDGTEILAIGQPLAPYKVTSLRLIKEILALSGQTMAFGGAVTVAGNTTLGDASGDSVTINAGTITADNAGFRTSSGNLLVGTTSALDVGGLTGNHNFATGGGDKWALALHHTGTTNTPHGIGIQYTASTPNDAGRQFLYFTDSTAVRFEVRSNGGIANYSANNVNLSDEREKNSLTSFDAAADLEAFLAFPFVNYKYNDQTHDDLNLGTGAQSALASHPGNARFVDLDSWQRPVKDADGNDVLDDDGNPVTEARMSVYDGDIHYRTGAQAQYAHRRINELEAKLAALEARLAAAGVA